MDIEKNIEDVFKLQIIGAVPSVLCHLEKSAIPKRKKKVASDGLEDLLVSDSDSESDTESEMDLDEPVKAEEDHEMVNDDEEVEVEELKKLDWDSEPELSDSESDVSDEEFFVEESDVDD